MLKAKALYIVIIVSLVIAILTSAFVLQAYFYRLEIQHNLLLERLQINTQSGFNLLLTEHNLFDNNEEIILDLFDEERDSVLLRKYNWGLFEIGVCKAFKGENKSVKTGQIGYKPAGTSKASLYLVDQNRPLSLCGKTQIKGNCYLPEAGVKRAYIEGQSYVGAQLIYGSVSKSSKSLPTINEEMIKRNIAIINNELSEQYEIIEELDSAISRSFLLNTLLINSENSIDLDDIDLSGNIIIRSGSVVSISSNSKLSDVLIYAAAVVIEDGFAGNLQVFAFDSIKVGRNCKLKYPSALGLIKLENSARRSFIKIENSSELTGILFIVQIQKGRNQPKLTIEKGVIIEGQVFVDGLVELKGDVYGNITCSKFILRTPSSVYENHLLNVTIDYSRLSEYFVGSAIVVSKKEKEVVKWLY